MDEAGMQQSRGTGRGSRPRPSIVAAAAWCSVTAAMIVAPALAYRFGGPAGLKAIVQEGPISDLMLTLYAAVGAWLVLGAFIALLAARRVDSGNAATIACFFLVCFLYIGFIRERVRYGDVMDYVNAAAALVKGEQLPARYLYPPFWATLLKRLVPYGARAVFDVLWALNLLSLFGLFLLLRAVLLRYGFSERLAALATAVFMAVNVPIVRTLGYVQVNFHVLNLILAGILVRRRSAALSALAFALAVHLKAAPAVLVVAFIVARDLRWLGWFALFAAAIAGWTVAENGIYPYRDFLANAAGIWSTGEPSFRQFSMDSLVRAILVLAGRGEGLFTYIIGPAKIAVAALGLVVVAANGSRRAFSGAAGAEGAILDSAPALFVLMILLQPIAWPHHCVFLAVPFLVMLKRLETAAHWVLFGAAYFVVFLAPVHDLFPWSYGRLAALFVWLGLARALPDGSREGSFFSRANAWRAEAPRPAGAEGPAGADPEGGFRAGLDR